ncbi:hypothetical protein GCM10029992_60590 [Glycomyces albus]
MNDRYSDAAIGPMVMASRPRRNGARKLRAAQRSRLRADLPKPFRVFAGAGGLLRLRPLLRAGAAPIGRRNSDFVVGH